MKTGMNTRIVPMLFLDNGLERGMSAHTHWYVICLRICQSEFKTPVGDKSLINLFLQRCDEREIHRDSNIHFCHLPMPNYFA